MKIVDATLKFGVAWFARTWQSNKIWLHFSDIWDRYFVIIYIYILFYLSSVRSPYRATQTINLLEEKLIKENLGLAVLDTHVKRRGNVTPVFHIYCLCFPHTSSNLWTLYQVLRKVSFSSTPLSLLPLFRRREGLISPYILHRDLCCYPKLV
jgi:hypothetical protein